MKALALLVAGIVSMFFGVYGAAFGIPLVFVAIYLMQGMNDRCGNCGAPIARSRLDYCVVCRIDFDNWSVE